MIQNRNQNNLLCAIVFDFVDCVWLYSFFKYQKFRVRVNHCHQTQSKTKKWPHFFLRLEADFVGLWNLPRDVLKLFVKVWFHDKVTGLWAFEVPLPYQKYQRPPIVVRCLCMCTQVRWWLSIQHLKQPARRKNSNIIRPSHVLILSWFHSNFI